MALFMDVHRNLEAATAEDIIDAHKRDVKVQEEFGVEYKRYWYDETAGAVFCLFEAPSKEAGRQVHEAAHGLAADEIYEVKEGR